jgi:integrase
MSNERREDLGRFYSILENLEKKHRRLASIDGCVISRMPSFPMMAEKGHMREFTLLPASRPEFLERSPEKYRAIFEFLLETGLRVSECVSLTWDRLFLDQVGEFGRPYIYTFTFARTDSLRLRSSPSVLAVFLCSTAH